MKKTERISPFLKAFWKKGRSRRTHVSTSAFWQTALQSQPENGRQTAAFLNAEILPPQHTHGEGHQKRKSLRGKSKRSCEPGRPGNRICEHITWKTLFLSKFSRFPFTPCPGIAVPPARFAMCTKPGLQRQTAALLPDAPITAGVLQGWGQEEEEGFRARVPSPHTVRIQPEPASKPMSQAACWALWFRCSPIATGGSTHLQFAGIEVFIRRCSLTISKGNRELFLLWSFGPRSSRSLLWDWQGSSYWFSWLVRQLIFTINISMRKFKREMAFSKQQKLGR